MQALYSGISYAYNEASRATQPIINTIASALPTIGHEEAAVKESLSTCLHKMEAVSTESNKQGGSHPLWYIGLSNIKNIMLYPATRSSHLSQDQGCRAPNAQEWANWENVTSNINKQLENWSIPFRFKISNQAAENDDRALILNYNHCVISKNPDDNFLGAIVRHCDNPISNGLPAGGVTEGCLISIQTGMPKSGYAHELAHLVSVHPFNAIPLTSLHPDVLTAMCDSVTHGDELITSLSYWQHCESLGYPNTLNHLMNSRGEWGPIDLTLAKLATHREDSATHAQIHAECVDKSYEWIKQNYGVRAAEQFTASFAKSVFIHSMSAIVARTVTDKQGLLVSRMLIQVFANLIHLCMLGQQNSSPWLLAGHLYAGSGLMGRTVKALVGVIGDAAILRNFVRLMRNDSEAMLQLVYATCGTAAGNLFSTMILNFIDLCAPTEESQREAYVELTKSTSLSGVVAETVISIGAKVSGIDLIAESEDIYSSLPTIIQRIVSIDGAIANVIEKYVSLQVMTSWLWKTDQQKADAQVQASIHELSETVDGASLELSPSNQRQTSASVRRFHAYQTTPSVEPLESTDDDPLIMSDVAAVTGIGRIQADAPQKKLHIKKQV